MTAACIRGVTVACAHGVTAACARVKCELSCGCPPAPTQCPAAKHIMGKLSHQITCTTFHFYLGHAGQGVLGVAVCCAYTQTHGLAEDGYRL